ncbi:bifunctional 2-C-methyl-D-erythritol 4-phosphate cytidylyltransferase/2-C-methyl-D-erythritol 2,4-cyclodiphosphate synthase [Hyphomicrobiales bacterium 4NK60-0047b]
MTKGTFVLVVAAGRGARARQENCDLPKQYVLLKGQPVLHHVLTKFHSIDAIDGILPVIHAEDADIFQDIAKNFSDRLLPPVFGGATRQASVLNGLEALKDLSNTQDVETVFIHDGARPCFSRDLIDRLLVQLSLSDAVLPALPVTDTLKLSCEKKVVKTVDRSNLWRAQTPQCFKFETIYNSHKAATHVPEIEFTDDCSIAEWHGASIDIIPGEERNIKITTSDDFKRGEHYLSDMMDVGQIDVRVGHGFDVHAFEDGNEIILCGVPLPFDKKLKGHSDADVGLHALTDAIYGALGAGDIGTHFPPSDEQWRGTSSDVFLKAACDLTEQKGASISNVDVTLICEEPKIGPYSKAMRESISKITGLDVERVSVKATTTERLGFTGRGEGISALATATLIF